jgi:hypothetical protein
MLENNYSLAPYPIPIFHVLCVVLMNQTLGNMYYYPVLNNIFMHYALNDIIKQFGNSENSFLARIRDVIF